MALPDIKDAGALAGFSVWGWPYHGVCAGGSITLPNAATYPMPQPSSGLTWLIDMGLPPIVRSPADLLADAAAGFEWRNYALISGRTIYGKQLQVQSFIHVDASGISWMIRWTAAGLPYPYNTITLDFTVLRFGEMVIDGVVKTPINVTVTTTGVSVPGSTSEFDMEDVWTNGARALFGAYRIVAESYSVGGVPIGAWCKDMVSLLEISISGTGGVDGSGLVFSGAVIRGFEQLDVPETIRAFSNLQSQSIFPGYDYPCVSTEHDIECQFVQSGLTSWAVATGSVEMNDGEYYSTSKTRFAYYKPDGSAVAAKLKIGKNASWTINGVSLSTTGVDHFYDGNTGPPAGWVYGAHAVYSGSASGVLRQGIYLMEDNAIVDKIEYVQNYSENVTVDHFLGASPSVTYTRNSPLYDAGHWEGDLTAGIPIPTQRNESGMVIFTVAQTLMTAWRKWLADEGAAGGIYERSGSGIDDITWGTGFGIQRISERAAGFFKFNGSIRTYGAIMSPYGILTASITPAGNLYLTGNRKTGDVLFSESNMCYV